MRQLFIDMGYPRTGNTWRINNFYPLLRNIYFYDGHSYALNFINNAHDKILYADERLSCAFNMNKDRCNTFESLSRLKRLFPEASIIFVKREISSLLKSMYNQYVKTGGTETFNRWKNAFFYSSGNNLDVIGDFITDNFDDVFIYEYEKMLVNIDCFLSDLCNFMGVAVPVNVDYSFLNKSVDEKLLKIYMIKNFTKKIPGHG